MNTWLSILLGAIMLPCLSVGTTLAQPSPDTGWWHNEKRVIHYKPDGGDFVLVNGSRRFNRALYGTHTAFRVEAGDLPEFALYMPGMGGNLKFGLINGDKSKWLIEADSIHTRYRPGSMIYDIMDPLLGKGILHLTILALADAEGLIVKADFENTPSGARLSWAFGGASGLPFKRDGDIGVDPESSFYLQPDYCRNDVFHLSRNTFSLLYGTGKVPSESERYEIQYRPAQKAGQDKEASPRQRLYGVFPLTADLALANAAKQGSPLELLFSKADSLPLVTGLVKAAVTGSFYFLVKNPGTDSHIPGYADLPDIYRKAEAARKKLAQRVRVNTPDPYINTLGGALSLAADAIWEAPSYLHGAVAWRQRFNGWRGAYIADPLGWHDRAERHFSGYALSQLTAPETGPVVADTALNLSRQLEKLGTSLFSSGYICRYPDGQLLAHHYDMNLVFIDQLLDHFCWTGDLGYVKKMWPLLKRHLAWEKRNFDGDNDGLYDAYCCIWASDALQYSGGGVTHSSAYNYRSNKMAAHLAVLIGKDPAPYEQEAKKILAAVNGKLWLPADGHYAEYKDQLGLQLLHPSAGLWTIYTAIDEGIGDPFRAYENTRYVDTRMPHIPIRAVGLPDEGYYTLSTTDWQPYTWSLNNVALAESLHTSLAYWQAGREEDAYLLWKSALTESLYLSASPGGFEQLSYYDAMRGELYRDFADPIGMAGRTLVEGLFGIHPDALDGVLTIRPGLPRQWDHASLVIPDLSFQFRRMGNTDLYTLAPAFPKQMILHFQPMVRTEAIGSITVNGHAVKWQVLDSSIGTPTLDIDAGSSSHYEIRITWKGNSLEISPPASTWSTNDPVTVNLHHLMVLGLFDPQAALKYPSIDQDRLAATTDTLPGGKTVFAKVSQGQFSWWMPLRFDIVRKRSAPKEDTLFAKDTKWEEVPLSNVFNDVVTNIFKQRYLSPRSPFPTLQLPVNGIGNWVHLKIDANIDDAGLRSLAGPRNEIRSPRGIPFATPGRTGEKNILFTSLWDNYPDSAIIPLTGRADHVYLLMAGSTNPMQSRMTNGQVIIKYTDQTTDILELKNPENWWPIEQDYYTDGFAFTTGAPKPYRLYLKTGKITKDFHDFITITGDQDKKGISSYGIDGGAATLLDLPLDPGKTLQELQLRTLTNDVVIGLMALTLKRL